MLHILAQVMLIAIRQEMPRPAPGDRRAALEEARRRTARSLTGGLRV
jgi:hypothetical protein